MVDVGAFDAGKLGEGNGGLGAGVKEGEVNGGLVGGETKVFQVLWDRHI